MSVRGNKTRIGIILLQEFHHSWQILRQAIKNISADDWNKRKDDWSFSSTVYHIIETAEYYNRVTPEGMEWGKRAGFSWSVDSEEVILKRLSNLKKEFLLIYLNEIENNISSFLETASITELFSTDGFDNGKLPIIEKMMYLLRHNMFHIGELNKVLRDTGNSRIKWE